MTHHLVGITEIGELLGVTRQRANQLTTRPASRHRQQTSLAAGYGA